MTVAEIIESIEKTANAIGVSMSELCRMAMVDTDAVSRCRSCAGGDDACLETIEALDAALEGVMNDVWAAIRTAHEAL